MNDLGQNQLALYLNARVLSNLAISLDRKFFPDIEWTIEEQETRISTEALSPDPFKLENLLDNGAEDPLEVVANVGMPIPRLLYATANAAYLPAPGGASDREELLARLDRFVTHPGVTPVFSIPPGTDGLNNTCPIAHTLDVGSRFTFLRGRYDVDTPPQIAVDASGLAVTIQGTAYQGDVFSRRRAQREPTHDFELTLRYRLDGTPASDINLGPVPFKMVAPPPLRPLPLSPLPSVGRIVYAKRFAPDRFRLPPVDSEPKDLRSSVFLGQPGDLLYEQDAPEGQDTVTPRYRVEPRSEDEPERFVIRDLTDETGTILAEAVGGRLRLLFDGVASLSLTPRAGGSPVPGPGVDAIGSTITRLNPFLSQEFTCAAAAGGSLNLNQLALLGATGLDVPLFARSFAITSKPEIVTVDMLADGDPGPIGSVRCRVNEGSFSTTSYLPEHQTLALSDVEPLTTDASLGADLAAGFGLGFLTPSLADTREGIIAQLQDSHIKGLRKDSISVVEKIRTGRILYEVGGTGRIKEKMLPPVNYSFKASVRIRFEAVHSIARGAEDRPVDRFKRPVPVGILESLGLDPFGGRVLLKPEAAGLNPISFLAYHDPDDGRACFDCAPSVRSAPPVYDEDGAEIPIHDPRSPPPEVCETNEEGQLECPSDVTYHYGQDSFVDQPSLKHQWDVATKVPVKDDVDVDVSIDPASVFLMWLIGVLALIVAAPVLTALSGALGLFAVIPFVIGGTSFALATVLLPAADWIAGSVAAASTRERLESQNPTTFEPQLNTPAHLGTYLLAPGGLVEPIEIQDDAMFFRYRVVVQAGALNDGIPG